MIFSSPAAGVIVDTSALTQLGESIFLRTLMRQLLQQARPIVVSSDALFAAAYAGRVTAREVQLPGITEVAPDIDDVCGYVQRLGLRVDRDIAHGLYESENLGGFPIITADPEIYESHPAPPDLITLP